MEIKPTRRNNDLVTQEFNQEILIYDLKINKTYCLNQTSSSIWQLCDGKNSIAEIREKMRREYRVAISEGIIWMALDQLKKDGLLENGSELTDKFEGISRREVIRKAGRASLIALPIIYSTVAPTAANAQSASTCSRNDPCSATGCPLGTCAGSDSACTNGCESGRLFDIDRCCSGAAHLVITNTTKTCTCN